jgi:hypothetical protein
MLTLRQSKETAQGIDLTGDRMDVKDRKAERDWIALLFFGLQVVA